MYAAAVAAYGAGTFAGNAVAPLLRRRFGEDRLTAGALVALAIVVAFGALGASRAFVMRRVARPRRGRRGRPAGLRRDGPDARPDRLEGTVVRPLRDPLPARLGRRCDRRHGDRHPDPCQPRRRRAGPDPRRRPLRPGPARGPRGPRRGSVRPAGGRPAAHRARHRVEPPPAASTRRHRARRRRRPRQGGRRRHRRRRRSPVSTPCGRRRCRRGRSTPARSTGRWTRRPR